MFRTFYRVFLTLSIIITPLFFAVQAQEYAQTEHKHLLVIHSYDPTYPWTNEIQQGITKALSTSAIAYKVSLEYLDAKRNNSPEYLQAARAYFRNKYVNYHFDGVILTDDAALTFFNSLNLKSLQNLPTVAVGIGNLNATLIPMTTKGTIIHSESHIQENIDLIHHIKPNIHKLYYLSDDSTSSQFITTEIRAALTHYPKTHLVEIHDFTLSETKDFVRQISENNAVLLGHFNTELKNNIYHEYDFVARTIGGASKAPVFVFWLFYIHDGILGGYVTHSDQLGMTAINLISDELLDHKPNQSAPIQTYRAVFDYKALAKHHIDVNQLPANAVIINHPQNFIKKHQQTLFQIGIATCLVLLVIIFILIFTLRRRQLINRKNEEIVHLQNKELQIQKTLLNVLGEAIERRSGETSSHVKRVAVISAKLAQLHGLSQEEQDTLEIISPMHDVGKIAIPESILNKPGKLTSEEWRIMQSHAQQGYKLLSSGEGEILQQAAIIALEHHEHWNGNGYPDGKSGEDISIFARITAAADVLDALLSKRCYKQAWTNEDVVAFFSKEKGQQFDPEITELLLNNFDQFVEIRSRFPD